jgi:outer membrane lipoprotein carrier protein
MRRLIAFGLIFLSGIVNAAAIERFKAFAKGTQTARGTFEQKVYDRDRRLSQESKGSFAFQRPGKFRWVYDKPVDQVIVGDGDRVWIYDRGLAQVTVRKVARALGSTPAALLAGSTDVEKAFELADAGTKDGLEWLDAKPRDREAGFEKIRMAFNAAGLQAMELTDNFGQTTILRFTALEPNAKVDAKEFRFEAPKGADVLGEK